MRSLPLLLLLVLVAVPAMAQEDCPDHSRPSASGECRCDRGYEDWTGDRILQCVTACGTSASLASREECACDEGFRDVDGDSANSLVCELIPECEDNAHRPEPAAPCECDDGFVWVESDDRCSVPRCQDNARRPPGQERNPFACRCLFGFVLDTETDACDPGEPCEGENEIRTYDGECVCPANSRPHDDEDTPEREPGCACHTARHFDVDFGACLLDEPRCPPNAHWAESGMQECVCNDGYQWERSSLDCVLTVSDCGPNAVPSEGGEACVCLEGFFPAPRGTRGCVGDKLVRCPMANSHRIDPDDSTSECVCNRGYDLIDDVRCERPAEEVPFEGEGEAEAPNEGEGEGEGVETNRGVSACFGSIGPGTSNAEALLGFALIVAFLGLRKRRWSFDHPQVPL